MWFPKFPKDQNIRMTVAYFNFLSYHLKNLRGSIRTFDPEESSYFYPKKKIKNQIKKSLETFYDILSIRGKKMVFQMAEDIGSGPITAQFFRVDFLL